MQKLYYVGSVIFTIDEKEIQWQGDNQQEKLPVDSIISIDYFNGLLTLVGKDFTQKIPVPNNSQSKNASVDIATIKEGDLSGLTLENPKNVNGTARRINNVEYWIIGIVGLAFLSYVIFKGRNPTAQNKTVPEITAFQSFKTASAKMERIGIGSIRNYSGDKKNGFYGVSDYYPLESKPSERGMPNHLSIYLGSRYESYIETAKLIFHLNNPSDSTEAVRKFKEKSMAMLKTLAIERPDGFAEALSIPTPKIFSSNVCVIEITHFESKNQTWETVIRTKIHR
jgi:hypothetical protein